MKLYKLTLRVKNWMPEIVVEYCRNTTEAKAKKCVLNSFVYKGKAEVVSIEVA